MGTILENFDSSYFAGRSSKTSAESSAHAVVSTANVVTIIISGVVAAAVIASRGLAATCAQE